MVFFFIQTIDKMDEYGITSFGVSVTTLEEVFMKVGEGAEKTVDDLYVSHCITNLRHTLSVFFSLALELFVSKH